VTGIGTKEAVELLACRGPELYELFARAGRLRHERRGDRVGLCAIVNAKSGSCPEDCAFCAQSARYRTPAASHPMLTAAAIASAGEGARAAGAHCFGIVTSGRSARGREKDLEVILDAARSMKARGVSVGAALGELDSRTAAMLKAAGVTRYNHNLETSRRHFAKICSTHSYEDRRRTVLAAKSAGLQVCCGGIFGMGETSEDRADLALDLRELEVESVPLNFLNPIPGTPLTGAERLAPLEILKIIAVFRFMLPRQEIKVCGGREVNLRDLQSWMFYAGADGTMIGNYLTTQGRPADEDLRMLRDLEMERK
jgi:biotin synthase